MKAKLFVKKSTNGVWSSQDVNIPAELARENKFFGKFDGKRVKIQYTHQTDFVSGGGEMKGTIRKLANIDKYGFFEGKATRKYRIPTLGLFNGFQSCIVVTEITEL